MNGTEKNLFNVYTTATNRKTTCETLINMIKNKLPFDVTVEYAGSTKGDQYGIYCTYEKIHNNLGWTPNVSLQDGLDEMIKWALNCCFNLKH